MPDYKESSQVVQRKQRRQQEQQSSPPQSQSGNDYSSVTTVDSSSKGTLPTHVVLHLAGLGQNDTDLARLGRVFARRWAVSPLYIWGTDDPRAYVSPVTGERLTMKEARVFSNNFGAVPLASMLKNVTTYTEGSGYKTARGQEPVTKVELDAKTVGKFARVLSSHGPDLNLEEGVGMAVQLTKMGLNPGKFAQNMEWVNAWYANSNTHDPKFAMNTAIYITQSGKRVTSIADVQDAIAPGAREATERAHANAQALADRYGADDPRAQSAYQNWVDAATRRGEGAIPVPTEGMTVGTDYWDQVTKEADRIKLDQTAFENSFFNKFVIKPVGSVMHTMNSGFQNFWSGAVLIARVPLAGVAAGGSAIYDPQGDSPGDTWQQVMAAGRYQAQRLRWQEETPGSLIAEPMGDKYAHWVGPALDFAIGWELDPLVLAGKARQAYLSGFELPGILEHGSGLRKVIEAGDNIADAPGLRSFLGHVDNFSKSKISRRMFEATDNYGMNRIIYRLRGKVEARGTLDLPFMKALKDKVNQAVAGGMSKEEAWAEWQSGVKAHYLGTAPEGTIAATVVEARLNEGFRAQKIADNITEKVVEQPPLFYEHNGLWRSETEHQALMADAVNAIDESRQLTAFPGWLRTEVPGTTRLSEFGPRRLVRSALTSERVTQTDLGRRAARLPSMNPGRLMNFNDAPTEYIYEHATRWGVFPESELRTYESRMAEILNSGKGVEDRTAALVDEINNSAFDNVIANYALDDATIEKLRRDLFKPATDANMKFREQTFGVVGESGVDTPLLESQLRNSMFVMDPVEVRQGIRRYISMRDRMYSALSRELKSKAPELGGKFANVGHDAVIAAMDTSGDVYQAWLRAWKSLTVARPAYVTRVVLGDENLRFFATSQSMQDRFLSTAWGHRAAENPNKIKGWLDEAFGADMKVGDEIIPIKRAGAYEYEAAAAGNVRQADAINELLRGSNKLSGALESDGQWKVLVPTQANQDDHLASWSWDLTKQLRNSEPGEIALRAVADSKSVSETRDLLIQWAKKDNYTTLRTRIGVDSSEVGEWADKLAKMTHGYTAGDANIAKLALEGDRKKLEQALQLAIPDPVKRPIVHSPSVVEATDGGLWTRSTNKLYDWFVRQPEDALNRQPFYSLWKRRAEAAMYHGLGEHAPALEGGTYRKVDVFTVPGREGTTLPDVDLPAGQLPRATVGDAEGYVYHLSPPENFDSIRTTGLQPKESFFGIDPNNIPPEMKGGRLFFADSLDRAKALAHRAGDQVAFRVKASAVGETVPERLFSGSQFGRKAVDKNALEFLGADGVWHPVADGGKFVSPAISRLVDNASRDFALGQVRRIMFDFTKQSRLTELMQFVFPFPQPFFEGFQAWGHIAYRNPTALVHGKQLFDLGVNSGFFKKDPLSGEYMVPARYGYRWALIHGASLVGADPKLMDKLASPWIPLSSMNMLTSSTVQFGASGPLGAAIGGVPLPLPGMHPPLQAFLQWASKNSTSPLVQGYLFQYGPSTTFLPRPVKAAAQVLFPDAFKDESSNKSLALTITEAMHRFGLDKDENGNLIPLNEQERQKMIAAGLTPGGDGKTLEEIANENANDLIAARGFLGLFSPGPLRTAFEGQREDYQAFQDTLDANDGDFRKALDQWLKDNATDPSKWFVPAGKSLAGEGYGDGNFAVRVPPSELVYQMYRMDGIGALMRGSKQWAALMLVGTDPSVQDEQNFMAFSDLISKGLVRYKTPAEYYGSGVDGPGWAAYTEWKQSQQGFIDHLVDKYGSIESAQTHDAYKQYTASRQEFFNSMYTTNPHWVLSHLVYSPETKAWDWPSGFGENANDIIAARGDLKHMLEMPGLAGFPGVEAMRTYVEGTDKLEEKMRNQRITDINSSRAVDAGLFDKYAKIAEKTVADQPDTAQFLSKYFNVSFDDNGKVISTGDLMFNTSESKWLWSEVPEDLRNAVSKFDEKLYQFKNDAREKSLSPLERSEFYSKADTLMYTTWRSHPQVLNQWWNAQGHSAQQDYKEYAATKPLEFWTPFDFAKVLPKDEQFKLGKRAQGWMQKWADARLQISKWKDADPTYSSSAGYDAINAHIRSVLGKDKGFDAVIKAANTWGWGIDHVLGYGVPDGKGRGGVETFRAESDHTWYNFLRLARQAQDVVNSRGWTGINYGTDADRKAYKATQEAARTWVKKQLAHNEAFKQQWQDLTELNGDPIIGSLVLPDDYFGPVGSVNYGG